MNTVPEWLKVGVRVRLNGGWPRFNLEKGAVGTIIDLDISPSGNLRWITVVWDGLEGWTEGIHHYGWHAKEIISPLL